MTIDQINDHIQNTYLFLAIFGVFYFLLIIILFRLHKLKKLTIKQILPTLLIPIIPNLITFTEYWQKVTTNTVPEIVAQKLVGLDFSIGYTTAMILLPLLYYRQRVYSFIQTTSSTTDISAQIKYRNSTIFSISSSFCILLFPLIFQSKYWFGFFLLCLSFVIIYVISQIVNYFKSFRKIFSHY